MKKTFSEDNRITFSPLTLLQIRNKCGPGSAWLYVEYAMIAKWQKTNQIYATDGFMAKRLGCSVSTIFRSKKKLQTNGYVEQIKKGNPRDKKKGNKWYLKVNKLITSAKSDNSVKNDVVVGSDNSVKLQHVVKRPTSALRITDNTCLKDKKEKKPLPLENFSGTQASHKDTPMRPPESTSLPTTAAAQPYSYLPEDVDAVLAAAQEGYSKIKKPLSRTPRALRLTKARLCSFKPEALIEIFKNLPEKVSPPDFFWAMKNDDRVHKLAAWKESKIGRGYYEETQSEIPPKEEKKNPYEGYGF